MQGQHLQQWGGQPGGAQQGGNGGPQAAGGKNAFAWKPVHKPPVQQQPSTFQWSDGRDTYDKQYPSLGGSGGGEHKDIRQAPASGWGGGAGGQGQPDMLAPRVGGAGGQGQDVRTWHQQNHAPHAGGQGGANSAGAHGPAGEGGEAVNAAWPPKLQKFVERCFEQCYSNEARCAMQDTLKSIIEGAKRNKTLWKTDWDIQPLPKLVETEANIPARYNRAKQLQDKKEREGGRQHKNLRSQGKGKRARDLYSGDDGDMGEEGAESVAERQARERRNARFADMQQGLVNSGAISGGGGDDDLKFMSSEAILGTCMVMEKGFIRIQAMPNPDTVRPEKVLVKWAERLQVKYDTSEADYEWICDQFKAVRQDMVIQHIRNENTVAIYEQSARIALLEDDLGEFYKIQSFLMNLYKDLAESCTHHPEFLAYRIFYWVVYNNSADLLKEIKNMTKESKSSEAVKHALGIHSAVELSDYDTFFRLYPKTPNLGKCIVKHIRDKLRQRALRVVLRSYKPSIPLETLMKRLGLIPLIYSMHTSFRTCYAKKFVHLLWI